MKRLIKRGLALFITVMTFAISVNVFAESTVLSYTKVNTNFTNIRQGSNYINIFDPNLTVDYIWANNAMFLNQWFDGRGYFQFEYQKPVKLSSIKLICPTGGGMEQVEKFSVYGSNSSAFTDEQLIYSGIYTLGKYNYTILGQEIGYNNIRLYVDSWQGNGQKQDGQGISQLLFYGEEVPVTTSPVLNVVASKEKVRVGEVFTTDVVLQNATNIYAEDFKINYDNTLFEYTGFEEVTGYKVYNTPQDNAGTLRFIIASQGKNYAINNDTTIVKLKFRAKKVGTGKVDALKARIADTEKEFDIEDINCLEDAVIVEGGQDVNRTGEYTLLDLSIDGYYYGMNATDTDTTKYDADQDLNGKIDDIDLMAIVDQMLQNTNYAPNI